MSKINEDCFTRHYTVTETAEILGVSRTAIQKELNRQDRTGTGRFPGAIKKYERVTRYIPEIDVDNILKKQGKKLEQRLFSKAAKDCEKSIKENKI